MSGELSLTPEQQAIRDAAARPGPSLMIEAAAGCAKTTTLKAAAQTIKVPALALAFARTNSKDLRKALPGNWTVKSFNGLGHSVWGRVVSGTLTLDERKQGKLVTLVAREARTELSEDQWAGVRDLIRQAQASGVVPQGDPAEDRALLADNQENWSVLADDLGIDNSDQPMLVDLAREALRESNRLARAGIINYDDQIYCPVVLGGRWPQFPVGAVDEDQDLSPLQVRMLQLATGPGARLLAVGDRRQAIYAWRGASGQAAELIRGLRPAAGAWQELPLLTTFRCPKLVVERQQRHCPGYRAWHTNPIGVVKRFKSQRESEDQNLEFRGWSWKDLVEMAPWPGARMAVLCRNNAPIMRLALKLLRQGVGCQVLGRDFGTKLVTLARKILPDDAASAAECAAAIQGWMDKELAAAKLKGREEKYDSVVDRGEGLLAVLEGAECQSAGHLVRMLQKLFAQDKGVVTLSSIHRAKGLEWDLVMVLDPWRTPSKWAIAAGGTVLEQEYNLRYVAETRTRHTLVMGNLEDFR